MDKELILEKIKVQRKYLEINPMLDYRKRVEALKRLYRNIICW